MANVADLLDAAGRPEVRRIVVTAELADVPMVWLAAGQVLEGADSALIRFAPGQDGLQLSADNTVENLQIATDPERRALFNDTSVESLGRLHLRQLRIQGTVRLLACEHVRHGHVEAEEIDIVAADARRIRQQAEGLRGGGGTWRLHAVEPAVGSFCGDYSDADRAFSRPCWSACAGQRYLRERRR